MCEQLPLIARGLGPKLARAHLLPEYSELLADEEPVVKMAAVASILGLVGFFDSETRATLIVPIWKRLCEDRNTEIQHLMARSLGEFLWNTRSNMSLI